MHVVLARHAVNFTRETNDRSYVSHLLKFRNVFEAHRSFSLGPEIHRLSTHYQPLDYSTILSWLIVRPSPTLGSAVARGSESFVDVVHSRRYLYIQQWWVFETHRSASIGPETERPSTHYQPLDYSRVLPWLIARPFPTLGSAVAHGSESFAGVVVHGSTYTCSRGGFSKHIALLPLGRK